MTKWLKARTDSTCCLAHPAGHTPNPASAAAQQGDNPISFPQFLGSQHDGFITVERHSPLSLIACAGQGRRTRELETQPPKCLGVALPVLGDFDVDFQENLGPQQFLNPAAGRGSDIFQPRPTFADNNGFLAIALDI